MGLRGPAPKPTAVNILDGNPSRRPLNDQEPQPRETGPQRPSDLDEVAQKTWQKFFPVLKRMKVLTEADGLALGHLCRAESRRQVAQKKLDAGLFSENAETGVAHLNPAFRIVMDCERQILTYLREFGLTPAARTRIRIETDRDAPGCGVLNGAWRNTA